MSKQKSVLCRETESCSFLSTKVYLLRYPNSRIDGGGGDDSNLLPELGGGRE